MIFVLAVQINEMEQSTVSQFGEMRWKKCDNATWEYNPGNANLPIGDGAEAQTANREIGVPRVLQRAPELKFKLGRYRTIVFFCRRSAFCFALRPRLAILLSHRLGSHLG